MVVGCSLQVTAQTSPCQAGTLANVLGNSCSVGNLTLNFQSNFSGGSVITDSGLISRTPITPSDIGFFPFQVGDQAGFKLALNFVDGPGTDVSFFSGHLVQFSYAPQANAGFDITRQSLTMDGSVAGAPSSSAFVQILDFQTYPNSGFTATDTALDNENNVSVTAILTDSVFLPFPDLLSTGFSGAATTQLFSFTTQLAQASLTSATFLYAVGPKGGPPLAPLTYNNIDLPGANSTFVSSINNSGKTVGFFQDAAGVFHGYITDKQDGFTQIDFPGAIATFGDGLNDRGDVVGGYTDANGNNHGFLLKDGTFTSIDFPNAILTFALGINDRGQIVGEYQSPDFNVQGFLLDGGQLTSINHSPSNGVFTFADAINNRSEITGGFFDLFSFRGFTQTQDSFEPIDIPGQTNTISQGINEPGSIVGTYVDFNQAQHGFVRTGTGFRTVDFPGGSNSNPFGINASGQIVGQYADATGAVHSFLAEPKVDDGTNASPQTSADQASAPKRVCGSAEWRQHGEDIRKASSCQVSQ
jgi:probable HAF family extracellular repeat protein